MIVGVGEAMVEFAPVEAGLYARAFAGDTLNTCWYLAKLGQPVRYLTRVGADSLSDAFIAFLRESGIDAGAVARDPERTMGLYHHRTRRRGAAVSLLARQLRRAPPRRRSRDARRRSLPGRN